MAALSSRLGWAGGLQRKCVVRNNERKWRDHTVIQPRYRRPAQPAGTSRMMGRYCSYTPLFFRLGFKAVTEPDNKNCPQKPNTSMLLGDKEKQFMIEVFEF